MQIRLKVKGINDCSYIEPALLSVQPDNENQVSILIEAANHIVTLPLDAATAIALADALETQVQKMGGVL